MTTTTGQRWGFPKGVIDPGETDRETALKESWEEAGLTGRLAEESLGSFKYEKWGTTLVCTTFLMEVTAVAETWDEQAVRQRRWYTAGELTELPLREYWRPMLDAALQRLA